MTIDAAIDYKGCGSDGTITSCLCQFTSQKGELEGTRHIEHIYLVARYYFLKTYQGLADNFGMPVSFDEGVSGGCHDYLLWLRHFTQGDHIQTEPRGAGRLHVLFHPDFNRRLRNFT